MISPVLPVVGIPDERVTCLGWAARPFKVAPVPNLWIEQNPRARQFQSLWTWSVAEVGWLSVKWIAATA